MTRKIFLQLNNGRYVEFKEAVEIAWGFDAELAEKAYELHLDLEIENESERTPQKWVEIAERLFAEKYSEIDNFFCYHCTTWESKEDVRFYCDREKIGAEIYYRDEKVK